MADKRQRGMAPGALIGCCLLIAVLSVLGTGYFYMKEKYAGSAVAYSHEQLRALDEGSFEYKIASRFYTEEELKNIRSNTVEMDPVDAPDENAEHEKMRLEHVTGSTYEGWMLMVYDSDLLKVAVNPAMDSGAQAPSLVDYVRNNHAIAGINAGGFEDAGGTGNGGLAYGIVVHEGKLISGGRNEYQSVIGIDKEGKLICSGMTGQQALDWGIQEGVTFGPTLITNFHQVFKEGQGDVPYLNPRTAIGQRPDGTFLLLVLDGRGPSSFGAKYQDIVDVMFNYGAYMASNLDGGNSTAMIYNGEYVNNTVSMYGSRHLPTAFIVMEDK
ncbi:MAG: phosphodiester glycosidase family protein [Solobacterium sp.]|nr:phosphodiester glycosidase family protein [Solobacterium sp.]